MEGQNIIIKKVKKGGHGGHHGGSWKVAYADFVTAMMAFFLLLWLITMVAPEKRARVSSYFKHFSIFEKSGTTMLDFTNPEGKVHVIEAEKPAEKVDDLTEPPPVQAPPDSRQKSENELVDKLRKEVENKLFDVKDQIMLDVFEGGVRIEIVDKDGNPMFPLGLDRPILVQFWIYLQDVLTGDLGISLRQGRPTTLILIERIPVTIELAFYAMFFATIAGVPLGIISAYRHYSGVDVATMIGANIGVSMPVFVLGLLLSFTFAVILKDSPLWLPPSGRLSAGVELPTLMEAWHLEHLTGFPASFLTFVSRLYTVNALITGNWTALGDVVKHMILPCAGEGQ